MKYYYDGETYNTREEVEDAVRSYAEDHYDEMLDDTYGDVEIAGYSYSTSHALREVDPVAYRCGLADYEDSLLGDIEEVETVKKICKMTYSIQFVMESDSEENIMDWMLSHTPGEALNEFENQNCIEEEYTEEIVCDADDDAAVNYTTVI